MRAWAARWIGRLLAWISPKTRSARELPRREICPMIASCDGFSDSEVIDKATGQRLVFCGEYQWHMMIAPATGLATVYLELKNVPVGPTPLVKREG